MADLIDRGLAYIILADYYHHTTRAQLQALEDALKRVPAAEPEPERLGQWIERKIKPVRDTGIYEVQSAKRNICGRYQTKPYLYFFDADEYCPHCGARMAR